MSVNQQENKVKQSVVKMKEKDSLVGDMFEEGMKLISEVKNNLNKIKF